MIEIIVKYALFAVTVTGSPSDRQLEFIEIFDVEIQDHEIAALVKRFRPDLEFDYVIVEKQYHPDN